jgi:RNA polymerase sigma-70 factor, ECF subfamily
VSDAARAGEDLLVLYDDALADVYGYLIRRCGNASLAEDLTSETFLAAAAAARKGTVLLSAAWLMTVARNKLIDHWRKAEREERGLRLAASTDEPMDEPFDPTAGLATLHRLAPHHRAVLSLRYLDGLSVPHVAAELGRTVHGTEALLQRAKHAFRVQHHEDGGRSDG